MRAVVRVLLYAALGAFVGLLAEWVDDPPTVVVVIIIVTFFGTLVGYDMTERRS